MSFIINYIINTCDFSRSDFLIWSDPTEKASRGCCKRNGKNNCWILSINSGIKFFTDWIIK